MKEDELLQDLFNDQVPLMGHLHDALFLLSHHSLFLLTARNLTAVFFFSNPFRQPVVLHMMISTTIATCINDQRNVSDKAGLKFASIEKLKLLL